MHQTTRSIVVLLIMISSCFQSTANETFLTRVQKKIESFKTTIQENPSYTIPSGIGITALGLYTAYTATRILLHVTTGLTLGICTAVVQEELNTHVQKVTTNLSENARILAKVFSTGLVLGATSGIASRFGENTTACGTFIGYGFYNASSLKELISNKNKSKTDVVRLSGFIVGVICGYGTVKTIKRS